MTLGACKSYIKCSLAVEVLDLSYQNIHNFQIQAPIRGLLHSWFWGKLLEKPTEDSQLTDGITVYLFAESLQTTPGQTIDPSLTTTLHINPDTDTCRLFSSFPLLL